ncbi:MAG TPA: non-homologous end-joining DNA ligase [Woeseiaceae bacterium]|nr:non-homologous end-joining DNA ligase [Woeseiaceae bacterium]
MSCNLRELLAESERKLLRRRSQPRWTSPMLATLTDERFSDEDWIFERKLDGERALVFRKGGSTRLVTRNRKTINDNYPEIVECFDRQSCDFIVDGEIVAFSGNLTSFSRLQKRMQISDPDKARASGVRVFMYVFDIIHLEDHALEKVPLRSRKKLLRAALNFEKPLRFSTHRNAEGEAYYKEACDKGWEGVIAKDATAEYAHSRSRSWLKFKCTASQELVIGGFTAPKSSREGFGALLVGYYDDDKLRYAGKVGTGYDDEFLRSFRRRLERVQRKTSPFSGEHPDKDEITWVTPEFVGEFGFTEWTSAGKLRHPRFLGLRRDKDPRQVVRESPGSAS